MEFPVVFVAMLVKQKEAVLEDWLKTIENLDYPKHRMVLWVRTNNNTDRTAEILSEWLSENADDYLYVYYDDSNVDVAVEKYDVHEWNEERFSVLARIRQDSIEKAISCEADFYFVVDVDNFILPHTLKSLVQWNVGVVAPMLTCVDPESPMYSNYHNVVDGAGYFQDNPAYYEIHSRRVRGLLDIELVHCTYLIRRDVLSSVSYIDGSGRYEYVIFSDNLRKQKIPQYLDNSQEYGVLTLREDIQAVRDSLAGSI